MKVITFKFKGISVATSGDVDLGYLAAPSGQDIAVRSIYVKIHDVATANPDVNVEVHAASAVSGGSTVTGIKQDGAQSLAVQTTAKSSPASVTSTGEQDGVPIPYNGSFYRTYSGEMVVKAGTYLDVRVNRNAATGTATATAVITVWE